MKISTVALIIALDGGSPLLMDTLHDDFEIEFMATAMRTGEVDPLQQIYEHRERQLKKESEFGDYVEELLSQPFLNQEVQKHGIRWLKSKIRSEQFGKAESEAVQIISGFAYDIFMKDPSKVDFMIASSTTQVRIRIFTLLVTQGVISSPSKVG